MAHRNPWLVVGGGAFGLVCVLMAGVAGYWRYANQLPTYPAPNIVMPVPNAYEDYVAAGRLCKAAGGATIPAEPVRRPSSGGPPGGGLAASASSRGRPHLAYEPGAPLAQVREVVRRNRSALARLRQGFRKEYRSPPVVSFTQLFPEVAQYRELARVLVTEGKLAEREGRFRDAAVSYLDCLRLGVDVPRGGTLIHGLVGEAIQEIGLRQLQDVAGRLDGPAAAAAAREMVRLDTSATRLAETLTNEKESLTASLLETLSRSDAWQQLTGVGGSSSSGPPSGPEMMMALQFAFYPKRVMLSNIRGYMDALSREARKPYYARTTPPPLPGDPLSRVILPVFNNTLFTWARRDAHWRIAELQLATQAYEGAHRAPLPSLDALVPVYLLAVPQDPFAPKPMVYQRAAHGAVVYSRGPDGKDDGGKDLGIRAQPGMSGDIASLKSSDTPR